MLLSQIAAFEMNLVNTGLTRESRMDEREGRSNLNYLEY